MRLCRYAVLALATLLAFAAAASAECAWVLWVEAPLGSDQWSVPKVPQSQFESREECQKQADDLNAFERTLRKMHGASGQASDAFSCFPCTVDPRPEAALLPLPDTVDPRGPKGK